MSEKTTDIEVLAVKYPEILVDLHGKFAELLKAELGQIAEKDCNFEDISFKLTEIIRRDWAKQQVYIPQCQSVELTKRDYEIYSKFNGRNHRQLCQEYNISEQWLYKIIKKVREEEIRKNQGRLFG